MPRPTRFAAAARRAGVPFNVVDKPSFCELQFGAIVNRSPLLVAISTDGAAPVFAQAIRAKIEALLPQGLKRWAEAARDWRPALARLAIGFAERRAFWERFSDRALAEPGLEPQPALRESLLARAALSDRGGAPKGRVTLVGAGPGDPDLLTLKAVRALQSAEVILYDQLVSAEVLDFARREAKRILVGKTGHGPSCQQGEINALMLRLARQGKHVVRLKGGDPLIFGRAAEEIEACRQRRDRGHDRAGNHRGARRRRIARHLVDAARARATAAIRDGARQGREAAGRYRLACDRRSVGDDGALHAEAHPCGFSRQGDRERPLAGNAGRGDIARDAQGRTQSLRHDFRAARSRRAP